MDGERRVVRLLGTIVVLLVLVFLGTGVGLVASLRAARRVEERQQATFAQLVQSSTAARQALARFEREREALRGDPGGPLGRLDRQIQLMSLMVDEQMVLISELAGLHEAAARGLGGSAPSTRSQPRARARPDGERSR